MSICMLSIVAIVMLLNQGLSDAQHLTKKQCDMTPYNCFKPLVNFSLWR